MMTKQAAVYFLASKRNGTLYVGVTGYLQNRAWIHKNDFVESFTKKYGVHRLVYYELHQDMTSAITREKQIKKVEPDLEARANRGTKSGLEGFVGRNNLGSDEPRFPLSRE